MPIRWMSSISSAGCNVSQSGTAPAEFRLRSTRWERPVLVRLASGHLPGLPTAQPGDTGQSPAATATGINAVLTCRVSADHRPVGFMRCSGAKLSANGLARAVAATCLRLRRLHLSDWQAAAEC